MASPITVTVTRHDSEDREVRVTARLSPATEPYFSRSFGNYLPGDDEDVEVVGTKVLDDGCDVAEVLRDHDGLCEAVRTAAEDKVMALAEDAAEADADFRREERIQ